VTPKKIFKKARGRKTCAWEVKDQSLSVANHLLDLILKPVDPWFWPRYSPVEEGGGHGSSGRAWSKGEGEKYSFCSKLQTKKVANKHRLYEDKKILTSPARKLTSAAQVAVQLAEAWYSWLVTLSVSWLCGCVFMYRDCATMCLCGSLLFDYVSVCIMTVRLCVCVSYDNLTICIMTMWLCVYLYHYYATTCLSVSCVCD